MEEFGKVSVWVGNFSNEVDLSNYMKEVFDNEGDSTSQFIVDFEIDYIDPQFQEVDFNNSKISFICKLEGFSYVNSFVNKLPEIDSSYNSIVCLYNFKYSTSIIHSGKLKFIGCFDYIED